VGSSKFVRNSLYVSLESETDEADVRVSVNFGAEDKQKAARLEREQAMLKQVEKLVNREHQGKKSLVETM